MKRALAALLAVFLLLLPAPAGALETRPFVFQSPALSWPCAPQDVFVDLASAPSWIVAGEAVTAVHELSAFTFRPWPLTANRQAAEVVITWRQLPWPTLGQAALHGNYRHYLYAEVTLDPDARQASAVRHELGHVAGLGHTDYTFTVMAPYGPDIFTAVDRFALSLMDYRCR